MKDRLRNMVIIKQSVLKKFLDVGFSLSHKEWLFCLILIGTRMSIRQLYKTPLEHIRLSRQVLYIYDDRLEITHTILIPSCDIKPILNYIQWRASVLTDCNYFFVSKKGKPLGRMNLINFCNRVSIKLKLDYVITAHSLRWSSITKLIFEDRCSLQRLMSRLHKNERIPAFLEHASITINYLDSQGLLASNPP